MVAPVSPSTPISLPLFAYQTIALVVPSVLVAMGLVALPIGAHQTTEAASGLAVMRTAMSWRPVPAPGHPVALAEDMTT